MPSVFLASPRERKLFLGQRRGREACLSRGVFVLAERVLDLAGALVEALYTVSGEVAAPLRCGRLQHDSLGCSLAGHVCQLVLHAVEPADQLALPFQQQRSLLSRAWRLARGLQSFGWVLKYRGRYATLLRGILKIADLLLDFLPANRQLLNRVVGSDTFARSAELQPDGHAGI